ncbi:hypothetical protein LAZ67_2007025 [Cordylochernes scorpioides]|uniref:superoxide dismutase n=1 Tax=Cordylochernes scorpioides TaxID=51811 RepID=A0ABY6K5Q9_9ARAC|nr:hypothetical protein LAZ67_2007025 [Cordylochernes scorpioides]
MSSEPTEGRAALAAAAVKSMLLLVALVSAALTADLAPPYYGFERPALDYELPPLSGYDPQAGDLEPFLDGETSRVHRSGVHAGYVTGLNAALREWRNTYQVG